MDHRVPRVGLVVSIVCAVLAAITFIYLNLAFEGPSVIQSVAGEGYRVKATFKDTEVLPTKQPVMIRGLEVGKVKGVEFNQEDSTATVEFSVEDEYAPLRRDAKAVIGERTILGDPFVNLDPGTEAAGELESGSAIAGSPSVDFDEALDFLDEKGRAHVRSTLDELAETTKSERGGERLNATAAELSRTVTELRGLTDALRGQEDDLAGLVADASVVLSELGSREAALRSIVGSGRLALDALASNTASLDEALAETPGLLDVARRVLIESRPLLVEAEPLVRALRRAAPELAPVLEDLPSITADTVDVVSNLSGIPTMREILKLFRLVGPAVPGIEAATRNLVTALQYTAQRANGLAAFFANMVSVNAHGDGDGRWARFSILFEDTELLDLPADPPPECTPATDDVDPTGFCLNAYPQPNDALDPEPYLDGSYPALKPYDPPPP
jgi:phospholipid/cholesterol/gamma-HCH transport system substrate-binding protein